MLRLLKFVLPRSPLHYEVLHKHAFFRIVLLTAQYTHVAPAAGSRRAKIGMLQDAADLLYALHNVEVQVRAAATPPSPPPLLPAHTRGR